MRRKLTPQEKQAYAELQGSMGYGVAPGALQIVVSGRVVGSGNTFTAAAERASCVGGTRWQQKRPHRNGAGAASYERNTRNSSARKATPDTHQRGVVNTWERQRPIETYVTHAA